MNIRIHYPDGTSSDEVFAKGHSVGRHFFDFDKNPSNHIRNILCWKIIKVEGSDEWVIPHPDSSDLLEKFEARFKF